MAENPLSNLSYTNKDFRSIYPELLEWAKKLAYRWDPTISNESDPGVILLKLNAIIADKNNYNSDKNILEAFPETLTQEVSARSIYNQLGYKMPWYRAATLDISFKWVGEEDNELTDISAPVTIDKFQMVTDADEKYIYTTLRSFNLSYNELETTCPAIEGILNTMKINGSEIIELNSIDDKNRLYFDDFNVAQNGIFIYNNNGNENDTWKEVPKLQIEQLGQKIYEFGVDSRKGLCYVEFPEDISKLIGDGLIVKYITTNGEDGNIIARVLQKFYNDSSVEINGQTKILNSDVIVMTNMSASTNGKNPETISAAYNSYRKVAGTFDTLVTLRDYMNAIYNSELVSNDKVSDRTNDIQSTYYIVTDDEYSTDVITKIVHQEGIKSYVKLSALYSSTPGYEANKFYEFDSGEMTKSSSQPEDWNTAWVNYYLPREDEDIPELDAFSLKFYLLHNPGLINSLESYKSTFALEESEGNVEKNILKYFEDEKCIQHDVSPILPNRICLLKNRYPISMRIIPQFRLNNEQISELKININKALFKILNSREQEFGVLPNYDIIYDTILNADNRIKTLILDDLTFTTFAVYWTGEEFKELPISDFSNSSYVIELSSDNKPDISYKSILGDYLYENSYFVYDTDDKDWNVWKYNPSSTSEDKMEKYSNWDDLASIKNFRLITLTKNILAGRTPLFNKNTLFRYKLNQYLQENIVSANKVTTKLAIYPFGAKNNGSSYTDFDEDEDEYPVPNDILKPEDPGGSLEGTYTLKEGESIRLLGPSLTDGTQYSNYVKYQLILNEKSDSDDNVQTENKYIKYSERNSSDLKYTPVIYQWFEGEGNTVEKDWDHMTFYPIFTDTTPASIQNSAQTILEESSVNNFRPGNRKNIKVVYPTDEYVSFEGLEATYDDPFVAEVKETNNGTYLYLDNTIPFPYELTRIDLIEPIDELQSQQINSFIFTPGDPKIKILDEIPEGYIYTDPEDNKTKVKFTSEYQIAFVKSYDTYETFINSTEYNDGASDGTYTEDGFNSKTDNYRIITSSLYIYDITSNYVLLADAYRRETGTSNLDVNDTFFRDSWAEGYSQVYFKQPYNYIPANADYELKPNESITFFYKEEDSDDAPYTYTKYVHPTIIKPSFRVSGLMLGASYVQINDPPLGISKITGTIPYDEALGSKYQQIYRTYDQYDLSGTKTISERKLVEVERLKNSSYYYFITNHLNDANTEYEMQLTESSDGKYYTYTLETDEYFIYVDITKTYTEIVGPGTLLMFYNYKNTTEKELPTIPGAKLTVPAIPYETISTEGLDSFISACEKMNQFSMTLREQQIYNLTKGTEIKLSVTDAWFEEAASKSSPYFNSDVEVKLGEGITIEYTSPDSGATQLPMMSISQEEAQWSGKAFLNIQSSYNIPQEIGYNNTQSYKKLLVPNTSTEPFIPDTDLTDSSPLYEDNLSKSLYLLTSVELDKVGGENIDVSYLDAYGQRQSTYFYFWKDIQDEDVLEKLSNDNIQIKLSSLSDGYSTSVNLFFDDNDIIIPIRILSDVLDTFTLIVDDDTDPKIPINSNSGEVGKGMWYYKIPNSNSEITITLQATVKDGESFTDTDIAIIYPLCVCKDIPEYNDKYGITYNDLYNKISELDDEGQFNYIYDIPQDKLVKDPLEASSFFDNNHIWNEYVIPEAELYMSEKVASNITLINNK